MALTFQRCQCRQHVLHQHSYLEIDDGYFQVHDMTGGHCVGTIKAAGPVDANAKVNIDLAKHVV